MSFLGNSHATPRCYPCDMYFKTWKEKRDHDSILHDRYQSTDNQRNSWDNTKGVVEKGSQDYFVCGIHARKIIDGRCPVKTCENRIHMRKSLYLEELRNKTSRI